MIIREVIGPTGIGSHTFVTAQLVIRRKNIVSLDSQSNELLKISSPGLLHNKMSITILELQFLTFSPGVSWRKRVLSKVATARQFNSIFWQRLGTLFSPMARIVSYFLPLGLFSALLIFLQLIELNIFFYWHWILSYWLIFIAISLLNIFSVGNSFFSLRYKIIQLCCYSVISFQLTLGLLKVLPKWAVEIPFPTNSIKMSMKKCGPKQVQFFSEIPQLTLSLKNGSGRKWPHHNSRFSQYSLTIDTFFLLIFKVHCRWKQFSAISQDFKSEKLIFGFFEVIFQTYKFLSGRKW